MKRLIAALGLSVVALGASALEIGPPFEQLNLDRALPNLPGQAVQYAEAASAGGIQSAPRKRRQGQDRHRRGEA